MLCQSDSSILYGQMDVFQFLDLIDYNRARSVPFIQPATRPRVFPRKASAFAVDLHRAFTSTTERSALLMALASPADSGIVNAPDQRAFIRPGTEQPVFALHY